MDQQGFQAKVLPMGRRLFRMAMQYLKNRAEAEDAVQEVMVKLWNRRESLDEYRSLEAFAVTVTRHHCLDRLRARRTVSMDEMQGFFDMTKNVRTPLEQLHEKESVSVIQSIIDRLPEHQRSVIMLRDIEQYDFQQIAEILNMDLGLVRVTLSRARKKVREAYNNIFRYGSEAYQITS